MSIEEMTDLLFGDMLQGLGKGLTRDPLMPSPILDAECPRIRSVVLLDQNLRELTSHIPTRLMLTGKGWLHTDAVVFAERLVRAIAHIGYLDEDGQLLFCREITTSLGTVDDY